MPTAFNASVNQAPGIYVTQDTAGLIPASIIPFNRVYMVGPAGTGEYGRPIQIHSYEDALNVFGVAGITAAAIRLFFRNCPQGLMFFSRVPIAQTFEVQVTNTSGTFELGIDGNTVSYTAEAGDDASAIAAALGDLINNPLNGISKLVFSDVLPSSSDTLTLRALDPTGSALTATTSGDVDVTDVTGIEPRDLDYIWTIESSYDPDENRPGYLIAPEAFSELGPESTSVGQAMGQHAGRIGFNWVALVDGKPDLFTTEAMLEDGKRYTASQGELAYYARYVEDFEGIEVPLSAAVAGIALLRFREQGFQFPPAGTRYPIQGITRIVGPPIKRTHQEVLNPEGINVPRDLPNVGPCVYGARTRSDNPYFRFVHIPVVLSIISKTFEEAFTNEIFTAVDGAGVLFTRLKMTANAILYQVWKDGGLYGATPNDAYEVICGEINNPALSLEEGIVNLEAYVAPAPLMERMPIKVLRTAIGQVQITAQNVLSAA